MIATEAPPPCIYVGLRGVNTHQADKNDAKYFSEAEVKALIAAALEAVKAQAREEERALWIKGIEQHGGTTVSCGGDLLPPKRNDNGAGDLRVRLG
jgi:hypothetical protein